jgi:hypothetical protein
MEHPPKPEGPVDHELIKAHFDAINAHRWGSSDFELALKEVHGRNPFNRFLFGRALWTYVPLVTSEQIEQIVRKYQPREFYQETVVSHTYVHYYAKLGEKIWYIPPRRDHQDFLKWFEAEWPYATEDQRELGRHMLAAMERDGTGILVSLLALAMGDNHGQVANA